MINRFINTLILICWMGFLVSLKILATSSIELSIFRIMSRHNNLDRENLYQVVHVVA